jgi:DNA-binding MarR family transcriptional regulator
MTTRVVTQYYDKALQSTSLRSTQLALLVDISSREYTSVGELANILLMDQTTVTRNIEILKKNGYVKVKADDEDSRKRLISITERGTAKLNEALPLWEDAQLKIEQKIGKEKFSELLDTLAFIQGIT